jgi:hypothetical protein
VPIVSNSSPLIALARRQRLDLVPAVLQSILIPPAVAREIEPSLPARPAWLSVKVPSSQRPPLTSKWADADRHHTRIDLFSTDSLIDMLARLGVRASPAEACAPPRGLTPPLRAASCGPPPAAPNGGLINK